VKPNVCVRSTASRSCSGLLLTWLIMSGFLSAQAPNVQPATAYTVDITMASPLRPSESRAPFGSDSRISNTKRACDY
jgi:hypothetical protein